jgi:predicted transcriptional regulator
MAAKLSEEEIVTLRVLRDKGQSFREIASTLGICEGTVRYHCKRQGHHDGRKAKPRKAAALAEVIDTWVLLHQGGQGKAEYGKSGQARHGSASQRPGHVRLAVL